MATLQIDASNFSLKSEWEYQDTDGDSIYDLIGGPTTASKVVTFNYTLPAGAKVSSAKVHSTWGSPNTGFSIRTVNGTTPGSDGFVDVTSSFDASKTSLGVTFRFKARGGGSTSTSSGKKSGTTNVSEVYLLITYTAGSVVYLAQSGSLVPYQLYRAESGVLVPYTIYKAENGSLVQY